VQQRLISEIFTLVSNRPSSSCNFLPCESQDCDLISQALTALYSLPPLLAPSKPLSTATSNPSITPTDTPTLITYRHYATLYFIVISTSTESPLALLDLIQVFVEALDRLFEDVCELDLIFNFETLHAVLGEMIVGGVVVETGLDKVVRGVREQGKVVKRPGDGVGRSAGLGSGILGGFGMRGV
jgi:AP-3 complex subunit sigma